ncbi:MAG: hypothetical protein AAGG01_13155, partial [Planctomycetota bacterium]
LEGLENLSKVNVRVLEDIGGIKRLEGVLGNFGVDVDIDIDECEDDCEEECEEEECEEESDEVDAAPEGRDRFVRLKSAFSTTPSRFPTLASTQALKFPQRPTLAGGSFPASLMSTTRSVSHEDRMLEIARQIQAEVAEMRAELQELRADVLGAKRR